MIVLLLFVVAPIIELYVIIQTGQSIGVLKTIGLMILIAFLGSWLIKREGLKVWQRFATQVQSGQVPSTEIADGVCLLIAGALMIAPGFVSDGVALLLLFPPSRAIFRRWLMRRQRLGGFGKFGGATIIQASYGGPSQRDPRRPGRSQQITDASATEIGNGNERDGNEQDGNGSTGERER